jgi:hypothetical protein
MVFPKLSALRANGECTNSRDSINHVIPREVGTIGFTREKLSRRINLGIRPTVRRSPYRSVYFSDRPLAFSTGYLFALAAILTSIAAATSTPVILANSRA